LAQFYLRFRDWKRLSPIAADLVRQYPQSATAFFYLVNADIYTQNYSAAEQTINDRLKRLPDDESCLRASASLEEARGNFEKARSYNKQLMDHGRATASDRNRYAWEALFTGKVSPDDVDVARQASDETKNNNWAIMHTLACVYAEVGKGKEARDLLVKVIEDEYLAEPNSSVWYGYGRIYESYGEYAAANAAYARIENNPTDGPTSTYRLMQLRRKVMDGQTAAPGR
jgi:tetratricopeptide (TPR) repeat protein